MVRFKTDENLPEEVVELLQEAGHDAVSIPEQDMRGDADPRVVTVCRREQRVLLTLDLGFADIRTYPPAEYTGPIVLRPGQQDKGRVLAVVERLLPMIHEEPLVGKLWAADDRRVRIRVKIAPTPGTSAKV